jgi:hypothetical protein
MIRADTIYLGDNGRALCGEHLGVTARTTGCDLSGQRLLAIEGAALKQAVAMKYNVACEQCGKLAISVTKTIDLMLALSESLEHERGIDLERRAAASGGALTPADVEANDVEFRCDIAEEPDPFPGYIICGWCAGRGCPECEGAGRVVAT